MKRVVSLWNIVAGSIWAIISLIFLVGVFKTKDALSLTSQSGAVALVIIIYLAIFVGYVLCTIGIFISNYNLLNIGALITSIVYSILFFFLFIGIASQMDLYVEYVGGAYVFFIFIGFIVQAMAYFSLWRLAKRKLNNREVDKYWFRPAMYFAICLVITILALASFKNNYLGVTLDFGTFNNWLINILWIAALGFTGYAIKNPDANPIGGKSFVQPGGFVNQNMYGQQNGYPQQNMYNQQANPYVEQNAYNQQQSGYPQQNMYNQQANPYADPNAYNQQQAGYPQQNMYNQQANPYTDPNAYNQQQGGYPQQNMYGQQNGYVDPNGQFNNQQ